MENKYFTPDIEEMFVGCEFEMHDTWGDWKKLILTEDLLKHPAVGLGSGNERAPWYWKFRVPYLTKEQIEAEGWELIQIYPKGSCVFQKGTKEDGYELTYNFTEHRITFAKLYFYYLDDKYTRTELSWRSLKCKDINTFRKICKLLEI
jgi:hypothetical protein